MIEEFVKNNRLADLLRGASIIRSVEPKASFTDALRRSKEAEPYTDDEEAEVIRLIEKTRKELGSNGGSELDREQERGVITHMVKDAPKRSSLSSKFDVL